MLYCIYIGPFVRNEEAEVTSVRQGDMDELSVTRLSPGTNYTLLIYAENSLGRSAAAFTVYAYTGGEQFKSFSVLFRKFINQSITD